MLNNNFNTVVLKKSNKIKTRFKLPLIKQKLINFENVFPRKV